jgi:hypothetical protein
MIAPNAARPNAPPPTLPPMMFEDVTPEEVQRRIENSHETVRAMHAYWLAKRGARAMPRRADIDPTEIRAFLPLMLLVDVTDDERRFVYRLAGTSEVAERGSDPTGKSVAEAFFGGSREEALGTYEYVVRNRAPFCYRAPYPAPDGRIETDDIIYLPLSEDGVAVSMVLVYTHPYSFKRRTPAGSVM